MFSNKIHSGNRDLSIHDNVIFVMGTVC